ncbi:GAP1-N1 domain-containing protein [Paraburkholderia caballeronis]|uniref:Uncharacterized protein n=1 Tax=Paraburkholderia caballeronis TaxID=416943 RepID=A0A1H7L8Q6_9BURK|nr:hypothetical protein [Paraburkholderia caballeronis]PXW28342.1 hypothetical protein C7403_102234 [Paraburkholderia caballeronis]PXX03708.1 hypothetical protein C7407_102234 [Paraburkholderia caballeronis]RAK04452.1 hypothetical protein C7409_102234 [Paraburkholderia caballeronis]SED79523.1 hypothetical protein SAMN05445871_3941 [Paraburkholderia caballeronis]SEK95244.1 hypothetical protein SAMN05192542_104234 [Paraburkholderia caballeronis]
MTAIEQQLHGYRHGHELLSTSVRLPAHDQDLLDRLSDVAGPLGPGERFFPYLTCYPLPSGSHYVVARTWQDLNAPRAGCVRTRSLLIPMQDWMTLDEPAALAEAASAGGPGGATETISVLQPLVKRLSPVEGVGTELLEALFLEERMPVAVFGAEMPEIIALRLLTAIWPSYRRNFTLSTFCNSPRTIARKSFDLVFAPVEARSRFSGWNGRRIDGRRTSAARHRWSTPIVERVFRMQNPSLRGLDVLGEMAGDERGSEDALRVSLLWDELHTKVTAEPLAALGLLDIANTRAAKNAYLVSSLGPALSSAAATAVSTMLPRDAWGFLQTLAGKVGDSKLRLSVAKSIRSSAISLARRQPKDAISVVPTMLAKSGQELLVGALGDGLAGAETDDIVQMLAELEPTDLIRLMIASPPLAEEIFREGVGLDARIMAGLEEGGADIVASAQRRFLRHIISERHVSVFRILVSGMSEAELIAQVERLDDAIGLRSEGLNDVLVEEARRTDSVPFVRDYVASLKPSPASDAMLESLIEPTAEDVRWLVSQPVISNERRRWLLLKLIDNAPTHALIRLFSDSGLLSQARSAIGDIDDAAVGSLARIAENVPLVTEEGVTFLLQILPHLKRQLASEIAARSLYAFLDHGIGASREAAVRFFLDTAGNSLDGVRAIRTGLSSKVPPGIASRNLILFEGASPTARANFVKVPEAIAEGIIGRNVFDLTYEGASAAGRLLWDAGERNALGFAQTAATLLPFAMRERRQPASALIAVAFPVVYRGLQQEHIPDFLSLMFPFLDWDRCRIARRELASSFSSSEWLPTDIALAAARAGDATRILRVIARSPNGRSAIAAIESGIETIQRPWRQIVQAALADIRKGAGE